MARGEEWSMITMDPCAKMKIKRFASVDNIKATTLKEK